MKHNLRVATKDVRNLQKPKPISQGDKRLLKLAARNPPQVFRLPPPDLETTTVAHVLLLRRVITGSKLSLYRKLIQRIKG